MRKTTLLEKVISDNSALWVLGDLYDGSQLEMKSEADVDNLLTSSRTIVIDEAQRIPDIGLKIKILVDRNIMMNFGTRIFVSGSSSLDLASGIKESAVGRIKNFRLWPISLRELAENSSWAQFREKWKAQSKNRKILDPTS